MSKSRCVFAVEIDLLQSSIPPSDQSRGMFDVLTNSSSLGQHNLSAQSPQQQVISRGYHGTSGSAPVQVCDQSGDDKFKYTVDGKLLRKPRRCTSPKYVDRYQCVVCGQRMGQLNQMKQHLLLCHSNIWKEKAFCIDVRARELRKRQKILFCLQEKCGFYCKNDFELSTHETSIGDCPVPISKPGVSGLESEFLGFSCYEPVPITIESSSEDNNNVNGKFHNDDDASWNRLKCNKSYQCSYCTFTTLDLLSIKSHVVSQHKHDIPSCSASLASARRAGFSEIATKMTSDGNFVTSVNDRRVDGVSDDEENDVDDKQRGIIRDALNRSEVGTLESGNVGENGDEGTIAPAMDGGKVYTVL